MPTAAKLIAGLSFALIGFLAAMMFNATSDTPNGLGASVLNSAAVVGFVSGWFFLGRRAGLGGFESVFAGIGAAITGVALACIVYGFGHFLSGLMSGGFQTPVQAIISWLRISVALFMQSATVPVWSIVLLGGAIAGRLTGIANFRWT